MTVADCFDALTAERVYRPAMTVDAAIEQMYSEIGHFDPEILAVLVAHLDEAIRIWASYLPVSRLGVITVERDGQVTEP